MSCARGQASALRSHEGANGTVGYAYALMRNIAVELRARGGLE